MTWLFLQTVIVVVVSLALLGIGWLIGKNFAPWED
jgi:hypothetical protein